MAKTLTVRSLETLKPGPARREVPDGLVRGLYFVLQPSGAASWAVRYRHLGASRKLTLGSYPAVDLRTARDLASSALIAVAKGDDPAAERKQSKLNGGDRTSRDLIENVCAEYIDRQAKPNTREASWREVERILKREIVSQWSGRRLGDITRADIHQLLDSIVDRGATILANRTLAALRRVCNWAVGLGIVASSPCDRIKAPIVETSRDRILSEDEIRVAWRAFGAVGWPFGPLAQLLLLTGARRDELGQATWREIDMQAKRWTIPAVRSKNGREHAVPLSDFAISILTALPRVAGPRDLVFTINGSVPVSGFSKAKAAFDRLIFDAMGEESDYPTRVTPVERWTFHDLRRTAASGMAALGVAPHIIEAAINHKSGIIRGVAAIYNRHDYGAEKRAAMDTWARHLERIVSGEEEGKVVEIRKAGA